MGNATGWVRPALSVSLKLTHWIKIKRRSDCMYSYTPNTLTCFLPGMKTLSLWWQFGMNIKCSRGFRQKLIITTFQVSFFVILHNFTKTEVET